MSDYRILYDGSLFFPRRGKAPNCPPGYEKDPGDPFVCLPILEPCQNRIMKQPDSNCCGKVAHQWCQLKKKHILYVDCQKCK